MIKPALTISSLLIAVAGIIVITQRPSGNWHQTPDPVAAELLPGGNTSVDFKPFPSFMKPAANLAETARADFHAGKALAHQPWVKAPTITDARDGLGPLYNARTCLSCHVNGGRGHMPGDRDELTVTQFLRLSLPGENRVLGVIPEPAYGDQLQSQSVSLAHQLRGAVDASARPDDDIPAEADVHIDWQQQDFTYPDGQRVQLRKPKIEIRNLAYGPLHPKTLIGIRNAPPLLGTGLLQLIAQNDINALADANDSNGDGISGRVNQVWDFVDQKTRPGRFGLKANKPDLRHQLAAALHGDMGIANSVFPGQPCTKKQIHCRNAIHGTDENGLEINDKLLQLMIDFNMNLAVPKRRQPNHPGVLQGREQFYASGCQHCHHPSYVTGRDTRYPQLSAQTIWPYSDLLLHDMGEELADHRPDYRASGTEWRTPPLWGVGLSEAVNGAKNFLHDGRARSVEEAILWHGGEAEAARHKFIQLDQSQRQALIAFVKSL